MPQTFRDDNSDMRSRSVVAASVQAKRSGRSVAEDSQVRSTLRGRLRRVQLYETREAFGRGPAGQLLRAGAYETGTIGHDFILSTGVAHPNHLPGETDVGSRKEVPVARHGQPSRLSASTAMSAGNRRSCTRALVRTIISPIPDVTHPCRAAPEGTTLARAVAIYGITQGMQPRMCMDRLCPTDGHTHEWTQDFPLPGAPGAACPHCGGPPRESRCPSLTWTVGVHGVGTEEHMRMYPTVTPSIGGANENRAWGTPSWRSTKTLGLGR